jgi:hypothetical protein
MQQHASLRLPDPRLDFPLGLIGQFRAAYAPDVCWKAPRRGVAWIGRDQVVAGLLREAAAMREARFHRVRQSTRDGQIIDEFSVCFTYEGTGIENVALPAGAAVELERLRILTLANDLVTGETVIETWTVLGQGATCGEPPRSARP